MLENVPLAILLVGFAVWSAAQPLTTTSDWLNVGAIVLATAILTRNVFSRPPAREVDRRPWVLVLSMTSCASFLAYDASGELGMIALPSLVMVHLLGDVVAISLGRSFAILPALRDLRTDRFYRFLRHPIYSTYIVADVLYVACVPTIRNAVVFVAATAALIARALLEERVLSKDPGYQAYARRTPWRLVPGVF